MSCKRVANNIEIKSEDLKLVIKQFYKDASYYSKGSKNDTLSISFEKDNDHIKIGLYSFYLLNDNGVNYIGETQVDSIKCFFYATPREIETIKDLIGIRENKRQLPKKVNTTTDECFCKETYESLYIYKNGVIKEWVYYKK